MKIMTRATAKQLKLPEYFTGKLCARGHISERKTNNGMCRSCIRENHYTWYEANKQQALNIIGRWAKTNKKKVNHASAKYRAADPIRTENIWRGYYKRNKALILKKNKLWRGENADLLRMYNTKRRRQIIIATPPWANMEDIRMVYKQAIQLQKQTGEKYHVDHIIPLSGEFVCGLHVAYNLQAIPAEVNLKKNNKVNYL